MQMTKVKITVLKRTIFPDIVEGYAPSEMTPCEIYKDGQEFIVDRDTLMPDGFCSWAYADIHKYIMLVRCDADTRLKNGNTAIACCTDGFRPVIFKLEPFHD